jgi:hypothetical protein
MGGRIQKALFQHPKLPKRANTSKYPLGSRNRALQFTFKVDQVLSECLESILIPNLPRSADIGQKRTDCAKEIIVSRKLSGNIIFPSSRAPAVSSTQYHYNQDEDDQEDQRPEKTYAALEFARAALQKLI